MILPASSPKKLRFVSEKRLVLYGVAAGAALAAGVSPAEANLITLDLTPLSSPTRTTPVFGSLYFDVNAASAAAAVGFAPFTGADFVLTNNDPFASIAGLGGTNAVVAFSFDLGPKAIPKSGSQFVGSTSPFSHSAKIAGPYGFFSPGDTGYLGLRFDIGSDTHYGWANITVGPNSVVSLNTLGYESIAGASAHVPLSPASVPEQGSSLALLALGAAGIAGFRALQRKAA
jgi:hypothetical protein